MRNLLMVMLIVIVSVLSGCNSGSRYSTKVVKPKYHRSWFNLKSDKKVKRTRMVKMQS